jgi:hypothetical protein
VGGESKRGHPAMCRGGSDKGFRQQLQLVRAIRRAIRIRHKTYYRLAAREGSADPDSIDQK